MTEDEYVTQILQKYTVQTGPSSPTVSNANAVAPFIHQWATQWIASLSFSGSYAKGTAVLGTTDIDLFISFKSDTPLNLKEIYDGLYKFASQNSWSPRRQNVSVGITYNGTKIDLVPARIQHGWQNYHSLYHSKKNSWVQTNVSLQNDKIIASGRTNEIRAVKIWRNLHRLNFPSFYLELIVIDALYRRPKNTLADNFRQSLQYIADSLPSACIMDPANSNNVISSDLTTIEKESISFQARRSCQERYWDQIIW